MRLDFANRIRELAELNSAAARGGLLVVFGRRRVGKSRLLQKWLEANSGWYSQSIEAPTQLQIEQVMADIAKPAGLSMIPRNWREFFDLLNLLPSKYILCLDEFPYLTATDPTLPSILQRWLDHPRGPERTLVLSGSSNRMMNDLFLNRGTPLYARASKLLRIEPMGYGAFCKACHLNAEDPSSFTRFALVGGIPKYWEFVDPRKSPSALAEEMFFGFAPYLEDEPSRILRDEGINGASPLHLLEAVGRGAARRSEIARSLSTPETGLSRLLQQLKDASLLSRNMPFGESERTTKRTLYTISDPAIRFWFSVFSPHRSRWTTYSTAEKEHLLHDHASTVFEDCCRASHMEASRYWEKDLEFDIVRPDPASRKRLIIGEVKWRKLNQKERQTIERDMTAKWERCDLRHKWPNPTFEILDQSNLAELAGED